MIFEISAICQSSPEIRRPPENHVFSHIKPSKPPLRNPGICLPPDSSGSGRGTRSFFDSCPVPRRGQGDSGISGQVDRVIPSPVLDDDAIRRLCRFAIKHSFHWPPVARSVVVPDARGLLEQRLGQARWKSDVESDQRSGLATIGPGGGQWTLCCQSNRPVELLVGLPADDTPVVWVSSQVLEQLLAEESDLTPARLHNAVTVEGGNEQQRQHVLEMVSQLSGCVSVGGKPLQPR